MKSAMLLGKLRPLLKSRYLIIRESSDSSSDRFTYFSSKPRFLYREYFERDEKEEKRGQLLLTVFWAWVTYFFINHPEEVFGHDSPDPKTFTDDELGV